eukprot:GCRY01000134.1.p2 GENE.GCRY01000134.1~~GCRY01000134.1.p2  ORF type:complete len:212 (-),score=47.71 GCRY01000134.1:50-661(-)
MVKHNNIIPNAHFHKDWQNRVKTWFNQPARKHRRRVNRVKKAVRVAPRPVSGLLRPVVHAQTAKYNMKIRAGRGFSLEELKAAKINVHEALSIGIAVDHRRRNRCEESLKANVARLQQYKEKLIVFGKSDKAECAKASQLTGDILPINTALPKVKAVKVTEEDRKGSVFAKLRCERANAKFVGKREKIRLQKEEEEKNKKRKN